MPVTHLRLSNNVSTITLLGRRGATVNDLPNILVDEVFTRNACDFLVIDCGSNDLATNAYPLGHPFGPLAVSVRLYDYAKSILRSTPVKHIILCSALYRSAGISCSPEDFRLKVNLFNKTLKVLCDGNPAITYHTHRGFWRLNDRTPTPIHNWSRDEIHPNTPRGRAKYIASLRTAILNIRPYM